MMGEGTAYASTVSWLVVVAGGRTRSPAHGRGPRPSPCSANPSTRLFDPAHPTHPPPASPRSQVDAARKQQMEAKARARQELVELEAAEAAAAAERREVAVRKEREAAAVSDFLVVGRHVVGV